MQQKRKRDNLKLDIENEMKMLQEYFKDVDQCELKEEVRSSNADTHRADTNACASANAGTQCVTPRKTPTRAPWLTPEDKQFSTPRSKTQKRAHADVAQSPYAKHAAKRDAENAEPTQEETQVRTRRSTRASADASKTRRVR